jgi:hypothetical protein
MIMKKVLLYQHGSSYNHGCEALVRVISERVKNSIPGSRVYLSSFAPMDDLKFNISTVDEVVKNKHWCRRLSIGWFLNKFCKRALNIKLLRRSFGVFKDNVKFAKEMISSMNGPKEFRVDDLRITLTGEFSEVSAEDCSGAFQGRDVTVLVSRYDRGAMGNPTLTQFAKAVRDTNNHDAPLREDEYFWYYELDMQDSKSGKPLHYFVMFYKNPVDFYIVQFAVPQEKTEEYRQQVMEWARSVNVN